MSAAVVEVEDLRKEYGEVTAVAGISFFVREGEIFSLVGPNGAGKTTTVEILECLRTPTSGEVRVLGYDVERDEGAIKQRIGVVPQDFKAFERLTVKEHIQLICRIYGVGSDMKAVLDDFALWELRNRRLGKLSGGQQRRLAIAMAVAPDPELLFLDEPTTGLDPQGRRETWSVIKALGERGKTVIITSHYMEEVEHLADRAAVIVKGEIIANDTIPNLIGAYGGGIKLIVSCTDSETTAKECAMLRELVGDEAVTKKEGEYIATFHSRARLAEAMVTLYREREDRPISVVEPDMDRVFLNLAGASIDAKGELE